MARVQIEVADRVQPSLPAGLWDLCLALEFPSGA
jgi:hypothetical protein